ncbi:hypothetical protein BJ875DRAFT_536316 [Amylocarpus encephaloides]|uniref:Uncharacterized protein n=1 Tax=Amylocarpus encephaloides TaxID=45428 RepID=A0A9P7YE66_9HELO|nr:hypothetical protein BJ875DRAFT_536316 [Amylocarpus encephaloides]
MALPTADEELPAEADEPPDHRSSNEHSQKDFHKTAVLARVIQKESLLTKALMKTPETETSQPEIRVPADLTRRRSMASNASMASTAELTSDGGLTSPARTNTPSPPPPGIIYASFGPYSLGSKTIPPPTSAANLNPKVSDVPPGMIIVSPKAVEPVAPPKKRCITFACGAAKAPKQAVVISAPEPAVATTEPPKRPCTIKFACPGPRPSENATSIQLDSTKVKTVEAPKKSPSQSSSMPRISPRVALQVPPRPSMASSRRGSQSPTTLRMKPKCIVTKPILQPSEATRFHEFASEDPRDDDWIREELEASKKLTINDTLKKENAIRQLGNEAEEEALEEDGEEEDDDQDVSYSEDDDEESDDGDDGISDGNETDNEAGFGESDEDSDAEGEFDFWTVGRNLSNPEIAEASTYRASAHRTASTSSIDSVSYIETALGLTANKQSRRRRAMKIRPGTPELPDSTDFVCGTLDEDRPMENAYISCMTARKNAKHKQTPQDIDPSFPTSDLEKSEDELDLKESARDSDEHVWLHGKFEESDNEGRHRSTRRKSPIVSPRRFQSPPPPRRLHSPPPPKHRHRSAPPRKLFGHSPRRVRSPPPTRAIRSPAASPEQGTIVALNFIPLASRPGLTHTKSLPRAPNMFGRQYQASRIAAAAGLTFDSTDAPDGHVRGAIDIVKGLEQKRQRRKEKFIQKHCNRKRVQPERRPQPGKGAERMRELGLLMAGKTEANDPYMMSA